MIKNAIWKSYSDSGINKLAILIEKMALDGVLVLQLNRPEARNALNTELRIALTTRLLEAELDEDVRAVVIKGDKKAFAAGADINALKDLSPSQIHKLGYHKLWQGIADFRKPLVAAVNGYALGGGCELALHCDIIVAGRSAIFGLPEIKLGIMPGAGGTQRLVRAVGKFRALRLLFTGELIEAHVAAEWGLVSCLVDDEFVEEEALRLAGTISESAPLAIEYIKEVVIQGADLPLSAGLALERKSLHILFDSEEQKKRMRAFLDHRKPTSK